VKIIFKSKTSAKMTTFSHYFIILFCFLIFQFFDFEKSKIEKINKDLEINMRLCEQTLSNLREETEILRRTIAKNEHDTLRLAIAEQKLSYEKLSAQERAKTAEALVNQLKNEIEAYRQELKSGENLKTYSKILDTAVDVAHLFMNNNERKPLYNKMIG
jgi:leucyl-tRNA synthetase